MKNRFVYWATCLCICVACSKDAPSREEFVDDNFIELLHTQYNVPVTADGTIDLDNEMTQLRLKAITDLNVYNNHQISDLTGIRNLISLDRLFIDSSIKTLDVSGMKYLRSLASRSSSLVSLNIRNTPMLEILDIMESQLTSLDLSGHPHLRLLYCPYNQLTTLHLENLPALNRLDCETNHLSTLNSSGMKLDNDEALLTCGNQIDENGNIRILHLTLSERQREDWKKQEYRSANSNVEVTFK